MYHNRVVRLIEFFMPDALENFVCTEHAARVGGQQIQNIKFDRCQLDAFSVADNLMGYLVDFQMLSGNHFLALVRLRRIQFAIAAELGFYTRHQLPRIERFCHVIVCSR